MQHVSNKHDGHPNPMFTKCAHEENGSLRWIKIGTKANDKLHKLLTSVRLVNDIKRMSPDAQTSCLEGFHSTLNHWHPKMVCFSWLGTFCRHILASLHFNENVRREKQKSKDGEDYLFPSLSWVKKSSERLLSCQPVVNDYLIRVFFSCYIVFIE
ncbi:PREDICTED: uncharacterized protein LOC107335271 [Acropora digitifera]|uniref:uncharacterized protein LOC107335271 n=1 Tax=Acropora digitifera TaxID=70779 RepID=UPI00077A9B55|nr:PREDICTED: uncharacterized protein LOC107335271 [Acropora digitifera]